MTCLPAMCQTVCFHSGMMREFQWWFMHSSTNACKHLSASNWQLRTLLINPLIYMREVIMCCLFPHCYYQLHFFMKNVVLIMWSSLSFNVPGIKVTSSQWTTTCQKCLLIGQLCISLVIFDQPHLITL